MKVRLSLFTQRRSYNAIFTRVTPYMYVYDRAAPQISNPSGFMNKAPPQFTMPIFTTFMISDLDR